MDSFFVPMQVHVYIGGWRLMKAAPEGVYMGRRLSNYSLRYILFCRNQSFFDDSAFSMIRQRPVQSLRKKRVRWVRCCCHRDLLRAVGTEGSIIRSIMVMNKPLRRREVIIIMTTQFYKKQAFELEFVSLHKTGLSSCIYRRLTNNYIPV